ncbi:MAG: hypothetical protein SFV22_03040 [Saprospiraceae bacterium]|nr:hypothetical protein [Saprospiraceae bacterium]
MVKELTELVQLAEHALPHPETLLGFFSKNNHDVLKLYYAVQANNFRTEAEAIEKAKVGERTKFRQVARELLRCLEQMVSHIGFDKPSFDDLNHHRLRGFQLISITKSLVSLGCRNAAKKTAEEMMKIGLQYGKPEFVAEAAKTFMDHYSVASDDTRAFDEYLALYEEYAHWRLLEEKAQIYIDRIKTPYNKKRGLQKELAVSAQQYVDELSPYVGIIPSHNFHVCYYGLLSCRYTIEARYREASEIHDAAIAYFESRAYACNGTLNIFYYLEIANCVHLARYERGRLFLQKALESGQQGNINWYNTLELGFYLRMHEGDWMGAAELYVLATRHKKFHVLRQGMRETWHILGAYLFIAVSLTGAPLEEGMIPKFKSSKFRNDIKDFSRDKTGMNIAILAAEVLLDFIEEKDDELWDRITALEKYRERYLRDNHDTHRSQLFIKVLTIFARYHYDRDKFIEKAEPYMKEMRRSPLRLTNQAHELEIIPYEQLVELISHSVGLRWDESADKRSLTRASNMMEHRKDKSAVV